MKLKIYLADLTHTGNSVATEAFPLNIGVISSFAKKKLNGDADFTLFKYPEDLLQAIKENPPHVLGCTNYAWNSNLSSYFSSLAKRINPDTLTIWGGTNYPFESNNQEMFLRSHPEVDIHTYYEGEQAFTNIIERYLGVGSLQEVLRDSIAGCQNICVESNSFLDGGSMPRIKNLDDIPSPYVSGVLDKFFDGVLTPLVETSRGCPFRCNFCNAGDDYFNKVNQFSNAYVEEELSYIARKAEKAGVGHCTFTDNNFGMIPRDSRTVEVIYKLQRKNGWPRTLTIWTGKNSKERVIDATRKLGESLVISMSVQSMDDQVLHNIKRDNIKLDHLKAISEELYGQGRPQLAEVIMPLPGESLESHIKSLNDLLDSKVSRVLSHTLQMLHGTPYKDDPAFIDKYEYQTAWRIVPLDFSQLSGRRIFDVEEVAYATKDMSFDDYVEARKYMLLIELCRNSGIFKPLERYLLDSGINVSSWVRRVYDALQNFPAEVISIINLFAEETKAELWDSEEALVSHYNKDENYIKLIEGEAGGNVLFKHRILILASTADAFVNSAYDEAVGLLMDVKGNKNSHRETILLELDSLRKYTIGTVSECLSKDAVDRVIKKAVSHNIQAWLESEHGTKIENYACKNPVSFSFAFSERDKLILKDAYNRYGGDAKGIVKLIQRIGNSPFRKPVQVE